MRTFTWAKVRIILFACLSRYVLLRKIKEKQVLSLTSYLPSKIFTNAVRSARV